MRTSRATINWPAFVPAFEDPKQSKIVGKVAYSAIPDGTANGSSEIGHWIAAIPAGSKNKELAFDFIHWATSAEQQKGYSLDLGAPPTRKSVFTDPELTAMPEFKPLSINMNALISIAEFYNFKSILKSPEKWDNAFNKQQ